MGATLGRILALLAREDSSPPALDGFLDSLLQKFENCRPGLPDGGVSSGAEAATRFFLDLYEGELPRLREIVRLEEPLLSEAGRGQFLGKVDELIRGVVVPAYVRLVLPFTARERNDFYLLPAPFHLAERLLWGAAGIALGAFIVWAPFIPIWSKEVIFPFMVGGLLFPNLRRFLFMRRFERALNDQVSRADREIARIDTAYLTSDPTLGLISGEASGAAETPTRTAAKAAASSLKEGAS